ncbi:Mth938-like domain-containing protein [uncultured Sphingomonas sp.]|uniref:Mth938-like domain-containing protein n=1 Tax=uncultured Sphingomonas sp. TaxID=158754 RepID=UPI0035CB3663
MQREATAGGPIVRGFAGRGYRLGDDTVAAALLMTVDNATDWAPPPLDALTIADLDPLIAARPEFILIGTGAALVRPPVALVRAIEEQGIGVEAMDSRAAARAWGVLRGEGRVIAAALYPLDA